MRVVFGVVDTYYTGSFGDWRMETEDFMYYGVEVRKA
jgi:hypothetical protein